MSPPAAERLRGRWLWLFPLTYLAHLAEEAWAGETFPVWFGRLVGRPMDFGAWVALNALLLAAMLLVVHRVRRSAAPPWLVPGLATVVSVNALAHLVASAATDTYSPGAASGGLLWLPLAAVALRRSSRALPAAALATGVAAGLLAHAAVSLVALGATRPSTP